jgi:glycosyltransferase involved in cell wall biosynthesis
MRDPNISLKEMEPSAEQGEGKGATRVLLVSHSAKLYGAERSLALLAAGLDRRRFEPLAVLPSDGPLRSLLEEDAVPVDLVRCPWWVRAAGPGGKIAALLALPAVALRELQALFRLCRVIRRHKIDLVCTNTAVILSGALAARLCGRPHLWHVREILPGNPDLVSLLPLNLLHRMIFRFSRMVLANSVATAAPLGRFDRCSALQVVSNAVTPLPADSPKGDLSSLSLEPEDQVVALVGSIQPRKAPEDAIRAVAVAGERIPGLKLLVIGDGRPDYVARLGRLAAELGVSDAVIFAGYRPDARLLLGCCRALLMTAPDEPFGRVVAEAMLDGVPVIAVEGGGMTELVDHGVNGLLCPAHDPKAMARHLAFLHQNPEEAASLARAAREKAAVAWAPERYIREIEAAMAGVLDTDHRA